MPFHRPTDKVQRLRSDIGKLERGTPILSGIKRGVNRELKREFATGEGPYGPWPETTRHRQALKSRKLPQAFRSKFDSRGGLRFSAKTKRDMLTAHQQGYAFPARHVAAQKQFLTFSKKGKLIKAKRALNKKGEVRRGVYQIFARAHTVKARVLPARKIVPEGTQIPPSWKPVLEAGATEGMTRWYARTVK